MTVRAYNLIARVMPFILLGSWEEAFEEEMNSPFNVLDSNCPLWKLVVLHNASEDYGCFEIMLLFHHAIADGTT